MTQARISHSDAIRRAQLAASGLGLKVFRREVGLFRDERGTPRKIGIKGEADLQGWQVGTGRAVAIEVKTGNSSRHGNQTPWANAFISDGGLYILARYNDHDDGDLIIKKEVELAVK